MLKITKGLKKKKKGKKSKHKEEELFKPEELEAYRRDHQLQTETTSDPAEKPSTAGENEEWKKFNALTSGVDDILKKTQGDLTRIKSTSFFQRVPPPSEVKKEEEKKKEEERVIEESHKEEVASRLAVEAAIVEVSETESEEEDEDDIFDTTFIDAIAAGEVKLAYIPESPTDKEAGDDPFDTSYAEKVILGPTTDKRGKKLVPLGAAVEILTGRVQAPTCASIQRPSTRRQAFKEKDLLLGSFDNNANAVEHTENRENSNSNPKLSLLDDDAPPELAREPVDLSKSLLPVTPTPKKEDNDIKKDILREFDVLQKSESPIEDDDEFALLAAESLAKSPINVIKNLPIEAVSHSHKDSWNAFGEENTKNIANEDDNVECFEDDPFDTTFAENILPGQAELKLIEKEILDSDDNFDFNPRAGEEAYSKLLKSTVQIHLTTPSGERESVSSLDRVSEDELVSIKPIHRDLLGGSSSDLTQLGDQPLLPNETNQDEKSITYSDPFDTSIIDSVTLPGSTELKFLERELLGDLKKEKLSDDDFDPRADEIDVIPPQNRKVSFDLPLDLKPDLLTLTGEESKTSKPLTPYYVREKSIPESNFNDENFADPFDTSFVSSLGPGKVELRLLENELLKSDIKNTIEDSDFNPRNDKQVSIAKVVQVLNNINNPVFEEVKAEPIDLLGVDDNIQNIKVLTPAALDNVEEDISFDDPFDTSFAKNILPGKTELKLLESELISSSTTIKRDLTDPHFNPRGSISSIIEDNNDETYGVKPLSPTVHNDTTFDLDDDFDPFDTSIANNVMPGPSELKLIESELI